MTPTAVHLDYSPNIGAVIFPLQEQCNNFSIDRSCLVLSDDWQLIMDAMIAFTARCFSFDDHSDVEEAACSALFSPPSLAVVDLRLMYRGSNKERFVAFCRQLTSQRMVQVALIACADDAHEEKLFRELRATYYFPHPPSAEEMERLAIDAASRVRAQQRSATINLLRQASRQLRRRPLSSRGKRTAA